MENEEEGVGYVPTLKIVNDLVTKLGLIGKCAVKQVGSMTVYGSIEAGAADDDVIVGIGDEESMAKFRDAIITAGFEDMGDYGGYGEGEKPKFISYRDESDLNNIILTNDLEYFDLYSVANDVVEELQLFNKDHRIMVFEAVINQNFIKAREDEDVFAPPPAQPAFRIVEAEPVLDPAPRAAAVRFADLLVVPGMVNDMRWANNANQ